MKSLLTRKFLALWYSSRDYRIIDQSEVLTAREDKDTNSLIQ